MPTIYEQLDRASIYEVVRYLKDCLATERTGSSPQAIAGYMSVLLGCDNPFKWYEENSYPALTEIMNEAPDLEIGNIYFSEAFHLQHLKDLVAELEKSLD